MRIIVKTAGALPALALLYVVGFVISRTNNLPKSEAAMRTGFHPEERQHYAIERRYWRHSIYLAIFTTFLSFLTVVGSFITLRETRKAFQEGTRAVMAPGAMMWNNDKLSEGAKNFVAVSFTNIGKNPAAAFVNIDPPRIFATTDDFETDTIDAGLFDKCPNVDSTYSPITAFPGVDNKYNWQRKINSDEINQVVSDKKTMAISGCIYYTDFGVSHHTGFCFIAAQGEKRASLQNTPYCKHGYDTD